MDIDNLIYLLFLGQQDNLLFGLASNLLINLIINIMNTINIMN